VYYLELEWAYRRVEERKTWGGHSR